MVKKIYGVDSLIGGYVFSLLVWPKLRDALMEALFCNENLSQYADRAFEIFGGSCNYAFIIFFVIPGIYTAARVIVYGIKFVNWINEMKN